jgi:hypothetical protein
MDKFKLFYKEYLQDKVREGLKLAFEAFYKTLWDFIKEDVLKAMHDSLKAIEAIVNSKKGQDKKEEIVNLIMTKIKLPIVLRPFKGLVKKAILKKIDELLHKVFGKGFELLG